MTNEQIKAGAQAMWQERAKGTIHPSYQWDGIDEGLRVRLIEEATAAYAAFHPTVATEAALDALPADTTLRDADGDTYRKSFTLYNGEIIGVYWQAGPQGRFRTVALPATVLHMGVAA